MGRRKEGEDTTDDRRTAKGTPRTSTDGAVEEIRLNILEALERTTARKDIRSVDVQRQIAALLNCRTAQDCEALLNRQWEIDRG